MPIEDIIKRREYQREWARRKRQGLPTKGINKRKNTLDALTDEEKRIRRNKQSSEAHKRTRKNKQALIDKHLGTVCVICKKPRGEGKHFTHRKDGTKHKEIPTMNIQDIEAELKTDYYALLCYHCHKSVHWCMQRLKLEWEEIIGRLV